MSSLVQFDLWVRLAANGSRERVERHAPEAVQGPDVHPVERKIEELRKQALDAHGPARGEAHQRADGLVVPERHQRAEIAVTEFARRLSVETPRHGLQQM